MRLGDGALAHFRIYLLGTKAMACEKGDEAGNVRVGLQPFAKSIELGISLGSSVQSVLARWFGIRTTDTRTLP